MKVNASVAGQTVTAQMRVASTHPTCSQAILKRTEAPRRIGQSTTSFGARVLISNFNRKKWAWMSRAISNLLEGLQVNENSCWPTTHVNRWRRMRRRLRGSASDKQGYCSWDRGWKKKKHPKVWQHPRSRLLEATRLCILRHLHPSRMESYQHDAAAVCFLVAFLESLSHGCNNRDWDFLWMKWLKAFWNLFQTRSRLPAHLHHQHQ